MKTRVLWEALCMLLRHAFCGVPPGFEPPDKVFYYGVMTLIWTAIGSALWMLVLIAKIFCLTEQL